jgi:hypothetical protein
MKIAIVLAVAWGVPMLVAWAICADSKRREHAQAKPRPLTIEQGTYGPNRYSADTHRGVESDHRHDVKDWKLPPPLGVPIAAPKVEVDVPGTPGQILARLIEEALLAGRIKPGDALYWESAQHPTGVAVPVRIVPAVEVEALVAAEAEEFLAGREPRR